jgi:hypothetical protein
MIMYQCNNCKQVYPERADSPDTAPHVCYPFIIEHAEFDAQGKEVKPEKRIPRENIRNENPDPTVYLSNDKWVRRVPHPEERGQFLEQEAEYAIVSEGLGRTLVEA